ncbi:MAG: hypothetical protein K5656_03765, partial [Lachnospiraceae bacterium]|nr:hypothetical protein [Lachnospiraceae bacterium]
MKNIFVSPIMLIISYIILFLPLSDRTPQVYAIQVISLIFFSIGYFGGYEFISWIQKTFGLIASISFWFGIVTITFVVSYYRVYYY